MERFFIGILTIITIILIIFFGVPSINQQKNFGYIQDNYINSCDNKEYCSCHIRYIIEKSGLKGFVATYELIDQGIEPKILKEAKNKCENMGKNS